MRRQMNNLARIQFCFGAVQIRLCYCCVCAFVYVCHEAVDEPCRFNLMMGDHLIYCIRFCSSFIILDGATTSMLYVRESF